MMKIYLLHPSDCSQENEKLAVFLFCYHHIGKIYSTNDKISLELASSLNKYYKKNFSLLPNEKEEFISLLLTFHDLKEEPIALVSTNKKIELAFQTFIGSTFTQLSDRSSSLSFIEWSRNSAIIHFINKKDHLTIEDF